MIRDHIIEITGTCNLLCRHCYRKYGDHSNITVEDVIKHVKETDSEHILISGGEPFLHPDIKKILTEIKKLGRKVIVLCNGTNIDKHDRLIKDTVYLWTGLMKGMMQIAG